MTRDPRYDALFQPLQIGPVTAKNRFYQVPHCTGMGWLRPQTLAEMRGIKAEGGWGVVCTEYCSIHPASDDLHGVSAALWDDDDIRAHALMTEKVHAHGALAGVELWFGGPRNANAYSRLPQLGIGSVPNAVGHPWQTRAMDKTDIADLRRWHRNAALRAKQAGFDIVYVYATHTYLLDHFLDPRINTRTDEYGGSLQNRVRLIREMIEDTKDAVGDTCAIAVRWKADERADRDGIPETGERREMFQMLAELPDLWDINISDYSLEMGVSRFAKEGALEPYMDWIKQATTKPVVTVGRFTSPDAMVSQLRRGVVDLIGAARPSIADPFLPNKIDEGRLEDIRECIGCNICYSGDSLGVPIRCTQNPTMGEEWRKGWHPERVQPAVTRSHVLVVGAGPAGMEAARALGARGYRVTLADAGRALGGRVIRESRLPGLSEYIRVRDHRAQQFDKLLNVEVYLESPLSADDVLEFAADHVVLATGASWRTDRYDGAVFVPIATSGAEAAIFTPDDIMDGRLPDGPTVIFEQNSYYMGAVIAEKLRGKGLKVTYVTDDSTAAAWGDNTAEGGRTRRKLVALGVQVIASHALTGFDGQAARLTCNFGGPDRTLPAKAVVAVTARAPRDTLYRELQARAAQTPLPFSLTRIGDCDAPGIVAQAVYAGHLYARTLDMPVDRDQPLRHERVALTERDPGQRYRETLTLYYEEEIIGEACFDTLAARMTHADHAQKMRLMADVERRAAAHTRPLLDRHGLTPRDTGDLLAMGRAQAEDETADYPDLIAKMRDTFPGYVLDFLRLEAMAPTADRAALALLTEHETAAIDFLEREAAGRSDSTDPLIRYINAPLSQAAE
ncbi:MAG: FAD-dependent oxidoreductase [Pseudomonadota bacterium]